MTGEMPMNSSTKSKWQVRLAVLSIFVVGVIAGALATNIYRESRISTSGGGMRGGGFERVIDKLNLTSDQRAQVDAIFEDARARLTELRNESGPRFREVRKQTDERLQSVLTPEQWEQFKKMMEESRKRRPHGRSRRGSDR
jgi:Spy/CpxP family protein refolding chaperone